MNELDPDLMELRQEILALRRVVEDFAAARARTDKATAEDRLIEYARLAMSAPSEIDRRHWARCAVFVAKGLRQTLCELPDIPLVLTDRTLAHLAEIARGGESVSDKGS